MPSLPSHVRRKHQNERFDFHLNDNTDIPTNIPERDPPNERSTSIKEKTAEEFSLRHFALFTLKTQEINRLTDATTNKVIDNTSELLEQHKAHMKDEDVDGLEDIINLPQTPSMDFLRTTKSVFHKVEILLNDMQISKEI
ncbi:Hypothetical predicted protein [Paramuricea clavata]|uniref:Uncharacterized protein n=1 Tax=Paramuricea clavata TaxID=317549 RepID=A0A7D9E336_PARCT|nr:Hypothetical predicted protein [Paramuricea clavata]